MALAHASSRQPARPRLNRRLVVLGMILIVAALILKAYQAFAGPGQPLNILLMGVDEHATRTDVVVVAHWEPRYGQLSLVSLPRDTRVDIPCPKGVTDCLSPDKLAHAHHYGVLAGQGPAVAVRTVEKFLGIKIDHYVVADFAGFEKAVDALGGVVINVEKNLDYEDPYATPPLRIHLRAGTQKLNGQQALQYVRFRNDELGDIGRIQRTQKFFFALLNTAREQGMLRKLPTLATSLLPYVKTNLDAGAAVSLARAGQNLRPESLRTISLTGEPKWENNLWFWVADEARKKETVRDYITDVKPPAEANDKK